jgi:hypothetical protein
MTLLPPGVKVHLAFGYNLTKSRSRFCEHFVQSGLAVVEVYKSSRAF